MSLFADYFKEFFGDETLENEFGFVIYRYLGADQVYIVHIYVDPKCRKSGVASALADKVAFLAKERGCKELLGSVVPGAKHSTTSLQVLIGYGMELKRIQDNMLIFSKEI